MAAMGETVVYATACCAGNPTGDGTFAPLTVNYHERFSAAGRTIGGFVKREDRPKTSELLVSRLVDRPLRPMMKKGWANETQVLEWVLSFDSENLPEPLAITAAGTALLISDVPFDKAVAGVCVGWIPGKGAVVNPTAAQLENSRLELMVAGTRGAILMVEGHCSFLAEEELLRAVAAASEAISSMCTQIEEWAAGLGLKKAKREGDVLPPSDGLEAEVEALVGEQLRQLYSTASCTEERSTGENEAKIKVESALMPKLAANNGPTDSDGINGQQHGVEVTTAQIQQALKHVMSQAMRRVVLEQGLRVDGRGLADVRPISSRAGLLPRTHGSCLFTRGETQAIAVATLGSRTDALRSDTMRNERGEPDSDRFYLQYYFPPSSTGDVRRVGFPGRRELGHGQLAQRALAHVLPSEADFPYTVRVEATITESNGSSSMATVCGGCLAMLDAGVPLLRPVAGIAMGLVLGPNGTFSVLSDIMGSEDALGDMDLKVAGDQNSITAIQMDIKVEGITLDIMRAALQQAKAGRQHILAEMAKCSPPPKAKISPHAPHIMRLKVDPSKAGLVIGSSGRTIKQIKEESGANEITIDETGNIEVLAPSQAAADAVASMVQLLVGDPPVGQVFRRRKVMRLLPFGALVEVGPGREGLVHMSELAMGAVTEPSRVVKVGDIVDVMVLETGPKLALSRKAVMLLDAQADAAAAGPAATPAPAAAPTVPGSTVDAAAAAMVAAAFAATREGSALMAAAGSAASAPGAASVTAAAAATATVARSGAPWAQPAVGAAAVAVAVAGAALAVGPKGSPGGADDGYGEEIDDPVLGQTLYAAGVEPAAEAAGQRASSASRQLHASAAPAPAAPAHPADAMAARWGPTTLPASKVRLRAGSSMRRFTADHSKTTPAQSQSPRKYTPESGARESPTTVDSHVVRQHRQGGPRAL